MQPLNNTAPELGHKHQALASLGKHYVGCAIVDEGFYNITSNRTQNNEAVK